MTESDKDKISLGAALAQVSCTPAEASVFLSMLANQFPSHADLADALRTTADDIAYATVAPSSEPASHRGSVSVSKRDD